MSIGAAMRTVADEALEASVIGSFSSLGPALRPRLAGWREPLHAARRRVVVTGATSGLGLAAARRLAGLGAEVCLVGRDRNKLDAAAASVTDSVHGAATSKLGAVTSELADMEDLGQVVELAERLADRPGGVEVLVNNAGAMVSPRRARPAGLEATVVTDLLAPFLLTERLVPSLAANGGRVISVTSGGMYTQRFDLDRLVVPAAGYRPSVAYARAKRALVVLTGEWQRRYGSSGVDFHVMHPGWADTPGLSASLPRFSRLARPLLRTADAGADTAVWLAGEAKGEPPGGRLWLDRRPRSPHRVPWTWSSPSQSLADGERLWQWCNEKVQAVLDAGA